MNIVVIGSNGKMGSSLIEYLTKNGHDTFGIDISNREIPTTFLPDVFVDFSSSLALKDNLTLAKLYNKPIIIATTAHNAENIKLIKSTAKSLPIFIDTNFSLGFNAVKQCLKNFSLLKNYNFVITETHHKHKKDIPSGSALAIKQALKKLNISSNIISLRVGNVVGKHQVNIYGDNEQISLTHTAFSRNIFCEGALLACQFIVSKPHGLFCMKDLLQYDS